MPDAGGALTVDRLSVSFSGHEVLHAVSFTLGAGEFCGLIGGNGSGKTTLLRAILGLQPTSAGSVTIAQPGSIRRSHPTVGYVPQKIFLDPWMPLRGRDLVALGLDANRFGLPLPSPARRRAVAAMLTAVGAERFADQRLGNLSGGEQQRILIAHALIRRPPLLLLDEPLASLDMGSVAGIVALLRRLADEQRVTILLSAHDMNPLLPATDRIVYLANGRAASGRTDDVVRTEVLSALYGYHIDVLRVHGRVVVVAAGTPADSLAAVAHDPTHLAHVP